MTPNKIDKSLIERIITEGPQAAFYNVILAIYIGMSCMLALRGAAHLSTTREPVNSRVAAARVPVKEWSLGAVFVFDDPLETMSLHFVESFTNVAFGATDADTRGLNFNLVDKAVRECLLPTKLAAKIVVAFERLLEDHPGLGYRWPTSEDKEGWERLLKPALPDGLPCSPITIGLIFSGHRGYVARMTNTPLFDAIASKRTVSGWYRRSDGEPYLRLPASPEHLIRPNWGVGYSRAAVHPATVLERLCSLYHPYLEAELQLPGSTTSRDRKV